MSEVTERIKKLRRTLGLTQEAFSAELKTVPSTISNYESGRREPSPAILALIAQKFGVNEAWLRDGSGEMFALQSREEKIAQFIGGLMRDVEESDFKLDFISALASLSLEDWQLVEKFSKKLLKEMEKEKGSG